MIRDQILQAIAEVGVVTAVIFTVVVTWTTTTTATRTTTDGPASSRPIPGEAKWEVALGELLGPTHIEEKTRAWSKI